MGECIDSDIFFFNVASMIHLVVIDINDYDYDNDFDHR